MMKLLGLLLLMIPGVAFADVVTALTTIGSSILGSGAAGALGAAGTAAVGAGAAALGAKTLMGKKPKAAAASAAAPAPAVMPTADDASIQAAKRKRVAEMQSRQGRASTILSDADLLGG